MTATASELLRANLHGVFGERDRAKRRAVAAATYTHDVAFSDPEGAVVGPEAVEAKAAALLDGAPGFVFAEDGPIYALGADRAALPWAFGPEGAPVVHGLDVITIVDGRISAVLTFVAP